MALLCLLSLSMAILSGALKRHTVPESFPASTQSCLLSVGDEVRAQHGTGVFFPAHVKNINYGSNDIAVSVELEWDDGDTENREVEPWQVVRQHSANGLISPGERVSALYDTSGQSFFATVVSIHHDGSVLVDWDDGDTNHRRLRASQVTKLQGHIKVMAEFGKTKVSYPATMVSSASGMVTVMWDDGDDRHTRIGKDQILRCYVAGGLVCPGEIVRALYVDGNRHLATVVSAHSGGTVTVDWDNGSVNNRVVAACGVTKLAGHVRVTAEYATTKVSYLATMISSSADSPGMVSVDWDDGDPRERVISKENILRCYVANGLISVGEHVRAEYGQSEERYLATVVDILSDNTISVAWDDGDHEHRVVAQAKVHKLVGHIKVVAEYGQTGVSYPAWLVTTYARNSDGTVALNWIDGDTMHSQVSKHKVFRCHEAEGFIKVGDSVVAEYAGASDGSSYDASVSNILPDGTVSLVWADGDTKHRLVAAEKVSVRDGIIKAAFQYSGGETTSLGSLSVHGDGAVAVDWTEGGGEGAESTLTNSPDVVKRFLLTVILSKLRAHRLHRRLQEEIEFNELPSQNFHKIVTSRQQPWNADAGSNSPSTEHLVEEFYPKVLLPSPRHPITRMQQLINVYTKEDDRPLYKEMNKCLRTGDEQGLQKCAAYIMDLREVFRPSNLRLLQLVPFSGRVWRGIQLDPAQLGIKEKLYKKGCVFHWPAFTSTATQKQSALEFGNVVFEINVSIPASPSDEMFFPASIGRYSAFPTENEVLFPPEMKFRVKEQRLECKPLVIVCEALFLDD